MNFWDYLFLITCLVLSLLISYNICIKFINNPYIGSIANIKDIILGIILQICILSAVFKISLFKKELSL